MSRAPDHRPRPNGGPPAPGGGHEPRPEQPRRIRNGIKLRARDGAIPTTPLSDRVLQLIAETFPPDEVEQGHRYARLGQIAAMGFRDGAIVATVQGVAPRPHETIIRVGEYNDERWERIVHAMAAEAIYFAKLLAGELPDSLDGLLRELDLTLLPDRLDPSAITCTCSMHGPCRHAAALAYLLADQLAYAPLEIFALRGVAPDRLLERIRQARAIQSHGVVAAHVDPLIPESQDEPAPLSECLDDFWRIGGDESKLHDAPPAQHLPHALLRRLGPSPLQGKFPWRACSPAFTTRSPSAPWRCATRPSIWTPTAAKRRTATTNPICRKPDRTASSAQ
jgi:uncharacterized Zn finger protein